MLAQFVALLCALLSGVRATGFRVDWERHDSVREAAKILAGDALAYYDGDEPGHTPGLLFHWPDPEPWWWAGGVLFGTLIEYAHYAGDATFNRIVKAAMVNQAGVNQDFLTPNWTRNMGNDDQGFWGLSAMTAAETNFENPEPQEPQWLASAQGVFNTMTAPERNDGVCGGGLRWQINLYSPGYDYKNSISNGLFFNLGARLTRYTGNNTYLDWANRIWDWERQVGLISDRFEVFDGVRAHNCATIDKIEWTYNIGVFLHGAVYLYNYTEGSALWRERVDGLLGHLLTFFPNNIATEISCQNDEKNLCQRDKLLFKGVVLLWLANVAQLAPYTRGTIYPLLKESARAAINQCTGGDNGRSCGFQWSSGRFHGDTNVGMEMAALSAVVSAMSITAGVPEPVTADTGGTSRGVSTTGDGRMGGPRTFTINLKDKIAAGFLTILIVAGIFGVQLWIVLD